MKSEPSMGTSGRNLIPAGETGNDRLLNVHEVAGWLGLSPGTVYHLASQRRIPVIRLSARCLKFRRSEILAWIETKSQKERKNEREN
jgi:excisionase family DNA binding protein